MEGRGEGGGENRRADWQQPMAPLLHSTQPGNLPSPTLRGLEAYSLGNTVHSGRWGYHKEHRVMKWKFTYWMVRPSAFSPNWLLECRLIVKAIKRGPDLDYSLWEAAWRRWASAHERWGIWSRKEMGRVSLDDAGTTIWKEPDWTVK